MMFKIFRVILIVFSLGTMLLSIMALIGSYQNQKWLTQTYLADFHLTQLNLAELFSVVDKRDRIPQSKEASAHFDPASHTAPGSNPDLPTKVHNKAVAGTVVAHGDGSLETLGAPVSGAKQTGDLNSGYYSTVADVINKIAHNMNYRDLGLADVYSVGYFGYCRGYSTSNTSVTTQKGDSPKVFDNSHVNFTWCSPPKTGYKFDPLTVIREEIANMVNGDVKGAEQVKVPKLTTEEKSQLKVLANHLNYENLNLPNSLQKDIDNLQRITFASMVMIFIVAVFGFVTIVTQLLGMCMSPHACWTSFLNCLFQIFIFLFALVTAGLVTGAYIYVRRQVNKATDQFGIRAFLSINFYAFIWSTVASSLLVVIFGILGNCCGFFGTRRRMYRALPPLAAAAIIADMEKD
ncbi:hypothetical protein DICA3_A07426 [Diutina catenulata]